MEEPIISFEDWGGLCPHKLGYCECDKMKFFYERNGICGMK